MLTVNQLGMTLGIQYMASFSLFMAVKFCVCAHCGSGRLDHQMGHFTRLMFPTSRWGSS